MIHLPDLIRDLGVILITAAVVILIFKRLGQPVVLGYIIAGFLVSHNVPLMPTVTEVSSIHVWAEIGVIFLLFGLGLEFSFKKLAKVGPAASITAFSEIFFMMGLGYLVGKGLGWSFMDSLFLGGILAISSTTIIVRAFDELGLKAKKFVSIVFGVLVVEDIVAILLLVLLSTVAVTQQFSGTELVFSTLRLGFFIVLWFVVGIFILPLFMEKIRSLLNDETTLIVSIGLCLLMVLLASGVGFSPALGAFVMGSILAETQEGKRIEHLLTPVKDLFAAIFFVSVGMLLDPAIMKDQLGVIVLLSVVTILGKIVSTTMGALIAGQSLRDSVQSGFSLAQIGEFSFIIATLGLTLGVTSDFLFPIAVTVSAVTTFSTPYLIRYSEPAYLWLEQTLPNDIQTRLMSYQKAFNRKNTKPEVFNLFWGYAGKMLLNSVIVVGIVLAFKAFVHPQILATIGGVRESNVFSAVLCLTLSLPFYWGIIAGHPKGAPNLSQMDVRQLTGLQLGVSLVRIFVGGTLIVFTIGQFASVLTTGGAILLLLSLSATMFTKWGESLYGWFEDRFMMNLKDDEPVRTKALKKAKPQLAPWDVHLSEFVVSQNSELVAKTLMQAALRERFGVTVALIERGHKKILAPRRDDMLLPLDKVFLIGSDEQLMSARDAFEKDVHLISADADVVESEKPAEDNYSLDSLTLDKDSPYVNKSINQCGLREAVQGLIVGVERGEKRILNPDVSFVLEPGDLLWLVGDRDKLKKVEEQGEPAKASE